jgi:hypothetical protein
VNSIKGNTNSKNGVNTYYYFKKQSPLIDEKESEENIKGHLIATKGRADLVIHLEKEAKSNVGVFFEVKKPSNKLDMVTKIMGCFFKKNDRSRSF